jgi:hypothetical protein
MYVARYSFNPEYDAIRNWSAWIGVEGETPEDVALQIADVVDHPSMLTDETGERVFWEDAPEALKVEWVLDNEDIRYHEAAGKWMHVHHEGLSCWSLDAETLGDAIEEARDERCERRDRVGRVRAVYSRERQICRKRQRYAPYF